MNNFSALLEPKILMLALICCVGAYLIGSINFAVIASKIFKGDDVRKYGSGNAGATNVLRVYGVLPAAFTTVGDFTKGIISIILSRVIFSAFGIDSFDIGYMAAFCALMGHLFPVFFGFKGGKGVLTAFGVVLYINPLIFWILFVIYVPMAFITRIVSLASILGMLSYPIFTYIYGLITHQNLLADAIFGVIMIAFPIYAHRENIKRLLNGTERRFGSPKKNN